MLKTVTKNDALNDRMEQLQNALDTHPAKAEHIHVEPARRLTGPNLIWCFSGAVVDIFAREADVDRLTELWKTHARRVLDAIGWPHQDLKSRRFQGGLNLAISANMDQLHSAVLTAQVACHQCMCELLDMEPLPFDDQIARLKSIVAQEANPALIALVKAAASHDVDIRYDDDEVSIGQGIGSQTWSMETMPQPQEVDWSGLHNVPLALITGTNGKTTTTRLCAAIARAGGKITGLTTTDLVQVDGDILDRGDYSGPGGARMVLRDRRVEIGVLEVARGGILRRGLATRHARVAVVTNIAKDHLGEYGVNTLTELAEAKFTVMRALSADGVSILNADDPYIVTAAAHMNSAIWWFSLDPASPRIKRALMDGQPCAFLDQGALTFCDGNTEPWSINVDNVPITLGGAARHNIYNVLAAMCACVALNIPKDAIKNGVSSFRSDPLDNPGRFNEFEFNGARIFVDYAHNPHSIAAVCNALAKISAKRRLMLLSQPGDRSDQDVRDATVAALLFQPDRMVIAEIADYLRGRESNEIPNLIKKSATIGGIDPVYISCADSPSDGTLHILSQVQPDDLVLLLVLSDRERVFELLTSQ